MRASVCVCVCVCDRERELQYPGFVPRVTCARSIGSVSMVINIIH